MKRGYTVRVFAPGFPESETCNPLDLIKMRKMRSQLGNLLKWSIKTLARVMRVVGISF
jgi:type IV secretory pathway TraG/TraD family ATPase VirD4